MNILINMFMIVFLTGCSTWADRCEPIKGEERVICAEAWDEEEKEYERSLK